MVDKAKTTLCVLFNHPYPANIPILEEMLSGKFDRVYFVLPNTVSPREDVITSYRGSHLFHGMIVDAAPRLLKDDSSYYFFMQDDVLINPRFSGEDWVRILRLDPGGAFLPKCVPIGGDVSDWPWWLGVLWKMRAPMNVVSGTGIENWRSLLPDVEQSFAEMERKYGFVFRPIENKKPILDYDTLPNWELRQTLNRALVDGIFARGLGKGIRLLFPFFRGMSDFFAMNREATGKGIRPLFPFCRGMSDFFAVNRATMEKLVHLFGVFAAMQVFVEVAIPTALLLAADRVTTEQDLGLKLEWYWNDDRSRLDFEAISAGFAEDVVSVHPIKLSTDIDLVRRVVDRCQNIEAKSGAFASAGQSA